MIINADSLLPHLKDKVRPAQSDTSRHLLCPHCTTRTRLNTLADGRRKCTVCGHKFRIHKSTKTNMLQQCAEILMCFCLDFTAHQTSSLTRYRHRLVALYYGHFRQLLAETSLSPEKVELLQAYVEVLEAPREKSWCKWCKSRVRSGAAGGRTPVFGVLFRDMGQVYIDILKDEEAQRYFYAIFSRIESPDSREGYAGFITPPQNLLR